MDVGDRSQKRPRVSAFVIVLGVPIEPIRDGGVLVRLHDAVNQQGLNPAEQRRIAIEYFMSSNN